MSELLAVLDACVLVPAALANFLLRAADADLYEIRWTSDILEEVQRTLLTDFHLDEARVAHRIERMRVSFPDAFVTGYSPLIASMTNHPKDRHVLAAAVAASAGLIVTLNLRDFPADALTPHGVEAISPDAFLQRLFDDDPEIVVAVLEEQAASLHNPPKTVDDILAALERDTPNFVASVRQYRQA